MPRKKKKQSRIRKGRTRRIDMILSELRGDVDYSFDHVREGQRKLKVIPCSVADDRALFDELVHRDYLYLHSLPIQISPALKPLLLPQSMCGRAHNGHGMFHDDLGRPLSFEDVTMEDIIRAIGPEDMGMRADQIKRQRQALLTGLREFIMGSIGLETISFGSAEDLATNPFGLIFMNGINVEARPFFKGFLLAGYMDNWKMRQDCEEHFQVNLRGEPLVLGAGETLLVDPEKLAQVGLTEQATGEQIFDNERLQQLRDLGVIVSEKSGKKAKNTKGIYFRRVAGPGVSDDAALVYLGKTYGPAAAWGALLNDAADTYDKYVEYYTDGGYDELLTTDTDNELDSLYGEDFVTETEIRRTIFFSAKANDPPVDVSSSHRRLAQIEPGSKVTTFLNHLKYIAGGKPAKIQMGYSRYDSDKFYQRLSIRADILRLGWN